MTASTSPTIDPARAVGADLTAPDGSWTDRDVMLYHLAVGAGADPLDPQELSLTYERDLRVLPTFGVIAGSIPLEQVLAVDGLDFDPRMLLHGEQELEVHARSPWPRPYTRVARSLASTTRVVTRSSSSSRPPPTPTTDRS